jgi:hypothetical protein
MEEDEDRPRSGGRALLGAFNVFLVVSAFVFGFLSGVISDGTVEVVNDFKRSQPTRVEQVSAASSQAQSTGMNSTTLAADAESKPAASAPAKPSGTIEWSIAVPPGTALTDVMVTSGQKSDPVRIRVASLERGRPATNAATMWLDAGANATISLPAGWYRIGSTRLKDGVVWDERAGDETYLDRALRIDPVDPSEKGPTIAIAEDGDITVKNARTSRPNASSRPKRRREVRDEDYFGLGRGDRSGGGSTYG